MKISRFRKYCTYLLRSGRRRIIRARSRLASMLNTAPHRIAAMDESRRGHAGTIADLFASIMCQVVDIGVDKLDTAMDILRHDFPNVEHSWLAERFQTAYEASYPLPATLALAAAGRTEEERISLALEVYTLLLRIGGDLTSPTLFEEVTFGLNLPGAATMLENLIRTPDAPVSAPLESITFSSVAGKDTVLLPETDADVAFRAIRCVNFLLIVNDADTPISVRGQALGKGGVLPLSTRQSVELSSCYFSYKTIVTLLQLRYTGAKLVNYISLEGDRLSMSRIKPRNCVARVDMGLQVEIVALRADAEVQMDGQLLPVGETVKASYFSPFHIQGKGPFTFVDLAERDSAGYSFQLDPAERRVLVTNLPYMTRPDVLKLTPGLAPGVVLEVNYSRTSNTGTVKVLESNSHTVTVGDVPVRGDTPLQDGDLIALSAVQFLRCRFSSGVLEEETNLISSLQVRGLTRDFVRAGRVVDNIDFTLHRGEMACILGPSGSGKSTLLSMLAGHLAPSFGSIFYNNERLTTHSTNLRRHIAFIPREDILDEAMTVGEHIYQASITRRPRLSHVDRMRRVSTVLNFVGIGHLADRHVGRAGERTISDGERTRLNLGLDLTGTSEVFLIDEPISGLSSGDAERVIETLEYMSHGRLLICTLHRPAQVLLNRFKKVMVLDTHGQMAFWGSPQDMMTYFRTAARDLHLRIPPEAIAAGGADYVFEVLDAPFRSIGVRAHENANLWQERFEKLSYANKAADAINEETDSAQQRSIPKARPRTPMELWRLFMLWVSRTLLARMRSRLGLYAMLMEGPVLAALIAGTLRASSEAPYTFYKSLHITEYLFLSLVLAMFFGLTDAACEILRDRPLLRRESNYRLFIGGYLTAKVLVLTAIAGLQCALYLLVGNAILGIHYMFWEHFGVMLLTAFVGIAMSLMVSAFVRSDRTALNIVPLLLVPQILLAGALVRFEEMNEFSPRIPDKILPDAVKTRLANLRHRVAYQDENTHEITSKPVPLIAEFCPLRYAFEMLFVVQTTENLWELQTGRVNELREQYKESGSTEELRFIQRAALAFNGMAANVYEAKEILRRVNKAAATGNEEFLDQVLDEQDERETTPHDLPAEFYFSNRKLTTLSEGVKTARKDGRTNEHRGFFLAPRQARPFGIIDQETDENSISTIWRNAVYLFLMGMAPVLMAAWGLKRISKGK
ncbi:MAG: ATP-binding cassette domain-containing protein [Akkermansia sp.]|nr:ATP-binding cassette domain-containing protein [Akkermansia sp.]